MKILWFTITPCGAAEKLTPKLYTAGWLASLEQQIKLNKAIDLSVCFYYNGELKAFEYDAIKYYPIKKGNGNSRLNKMQSRINLFKTNYDAPFIPQLMEVVDHVKPDIIHIHGSEENFGLIQRFTTIRTVISIQGLLNPYCEKFFSGVPLSVSSKHENLMSKLLLDSSKNQFFLFSKWAKREACILKDTKFIIGRTNWDKRVTRILAPQSKYFIGNEIMRQSFYKKEWNKPFFNKKIQIVSTMSIGLYKGLESVLKTASLLTDYNLSFQWLVIGQSDTSNYAKIIERWLKKSYKNNNVVLCGRKNEAEVADILCTSDIYCHVSHIENSPNSVCEAMLLGMPIVATFAGGTDSILENYKEGILAQDGDSYSLAGAIVELANNFITSKQFGKNARKTALVRHNPERVANEIIDVYKEVYSSINERDNMKKLKVSIVTPSYNQGNFIEETIQSVLNQDTDNLEYIIIDGGSNDNTVEIIKKYENKLAYWISEKDRGQTHAIIRGFEKCTGDIIAWINSDDVYCDAVLDYVTSYFSAHPDCMILAGNILMMDGAGKVYIRKYPNSSALLEKYAMMSLYQPNVFIRRSVLSIIGFPKEEYHLMMDHQWFSKIVEKYPVHIANKDFAKFRVHKSSKSSNNPSNNHRTPQYLLEKNWIAKQVFGQLSWLIDKFPNASVSLWLKMEGFLRMMVRIRKAELNKLNDRIL